MKRKIILKCLLCIICICMIGGIIFVMIQSKIDTSLSLQEVYIAKNDILPRSCIEEKDLLYVRYPQAFIDHNVVIKKKDIIGKYTDIQGKIPAGSLFYRSMLIDAEDIPDIASSLLKEHQAIFQCEVDAAMLMKCVRNMRVNVLYTKEGETNLLIEHARILTIEDIAGKDISSEDSTGIPHTVVLAVDQDDVLYLNSLKDGVFELVMTSDAYDTDLEAIVKK